MTVLQAIWSFLSLVVIAWITQRIVTYWEKRKKVEETKLALYMSWMPFFAESYAHAIHPEATAFDEREFLKKKLEILGLLQIMGPDGALDAVSQFCDHAQMGIQHRPGFDPNIMHRAFGQVNYCLCCEIHGERPNSENSWRITGPAIE